MLIWVKGGQAADCERMAEQYNGVVNFVQKDMKAKVYAQMQPTTNILSSFEQQKKQSAPEEKSKDTNKVEVTTRPQKKIFLKAI